MQNRPWGLHPQPPVKSTDTANLDLHLPHLLILQSPTKRVCNFLYFTFAINTGRTHSSGVVFNPFYSNCIHNLSLIHIFPDEIIEELTKKIIYLAEKYQVTFENVENDIEKASKQLSNMIDELVGGEADMEGLAEFKKLLGV